MKASTEVLKDPGYLRAIPIRIRATGQVVEMVPDVARAMILGGTAEQLKSAQPETMAVAGAERAVSPAQSSSRKPVVARNR